MSILSRVLYFHNLLYLSKFVLLGSMRFYRPLKYRVKNQFKLVTFQLNEPQLFSGQLQNFERSTMFRY